jgi:hypothetical protein
MIRPVALLLFILAVAPQAHAIPGEEFCGEATEVYLPDPQGRPASNIELANFQFTSPEDRCGRNLPNDELMRLHAEIKPLAATAFADSRASFSVMVRYTITADSPATFDMKVMDVPESEQPRLTCFYTEAAALKDFRSTSGTVYVVFRYIISPRAAVTRPAKGG